MAGAIAISEKIAKIALGVGKLAVTGGASPDSANEVVQIVKNGRGLLDDLTTAEERGLATDLRAAAQAQLDLMAASPDHPDAARRTALVHFDQALDHCLPKPDAIARAGLDWALVRDAMLRSAIAAGRDHDFARYYASDDPAGVYSRDFFLAVIGPVLKALFDRPTFSQDIAPALWRESIRTLNSIKDDTGKMLSILKNQQTDQIYSMVYQKFSTLLIYMSLNNIDPEEIIEVHKKSKGNFQ